MDIKTRTIEFLEELRLPKSRFAIDVNLSAISLRRWISGDLELSEETKNRIDEFLKSFNR